MRHILFNSRAVESPLVHSGVARTARALMGALSTLAVLAAFAAPAAAQEGQITGQITNAVTGGPIGQVQVYLANTTLGTLTRADGRYLMLNVPAGTYEIRAERVGLGVGDSTGDGRPRTADRDRQPPDGGAGHSASTRSS